MFGRGVRAAASFVFGGLVATAFKVIWEQLRPEIVDGLSETHNLVVWLDAINKWFIVMIFIASLVYWLAGAVSESQLGRV